MDGFRWMSTMGGWMGQQWVGCGALMGASNGGGL